MEIVGVILIFILKLKILIFIEELSEIHKLLPCRMESERW
jgi:hypothetical protein